MNIVWDWQNQKIRASLNSSVEITAYTMVLRDVYPITLAFVSPQSVVNQPYVAAAIESGKTILFTAKLSTNLSSAVLVTEASWVASGAGATTRYAGEWAFNTAELVAAMGGSVTYALKGEFCIVRADNTNEYSTQFTINVVPDVNRETDSVPTAIYPVIAQFTDDNGVQGVRIVNAAGVQMAMFKNGATYIFIQSTGLWYPVTGNIKDGEPVIALGAGEST